MGPRGMTSRWHIGAKELRGAIAAYAKRFNLLELRVTLGSPAQPDAPGFTPTLATLKRWRKSVPPHFDFAVVAGPALSRVKPSETADRELEAARAAVDALQARCFVLRTPAEVDTGAVWRDRIAKIVERVPHDVTHFVWEPSGVWEVETAAAQARAVGASSSRSTRRASLSRSVRSPICGCARSARRGRSGPSRSSASCAPSERGATCSRSWRPTRRSPRPSVCASS